MSPSSTACISLMPVASAFLLPRTSAFINDAIHFIETGEGNFMLQILCNSKVQVENLVYCQFFSKKKIKYFFAQFFVNYRNILKIKTAFSKQYMNDFLSYKNFIPHNAVFTGISAE